MNVETSELVNKGLLKLNFIMNFMQIIYKLPAEIKKNQQIN